MEDKLDEMFNKFFRKLRGTQHSLLTIIEKQKNEIDNGAYVSLFMDLSKAIDTINPMLAKPKAYRYSTNALNHMHSSLKNKKQKVQINSKFSVLLG